MKRSVEQPQVASLRTCTSCRETKPVDSGFYRTKPGSMNDKTYGCEMPCKECNRKRCRGYKRNDAQKARNGERAKRPDVAEQGRLRARRWYHEGPGKEWVRRYAAIRYAIEGDRLRAEARARYAINPATRARIAEATKRRRATSDGQSAHRASNSKYKTSERGRLLSRMHRQLRRVRMVTTECDLTDVEWVALVEAYERRCAYCGTDTSPMTIDHVDPVARGGAHTLSNVVPACNRCNQRKNAKPLQEALARLGVSRVEFLKRRALALFRMRRQAA